MKGKKDIRGFLGLDSHMRIGSGLKKTFKNLVSSHSFDLNKNKEISIVLSGGGSRAAYQVGAIKALFEMQPNVRVRMLFGSSVGAVNSVLLAAALRKKNHIAIKLVESMWKGRTFSNTFGGSISLTFVRSLRAAFFQYFSPGPSPTSLAIFDPTPLRQEIDEILFQLGGATVEDHPNRLEAIGVMTTVERDNRHGMLLVNSLNTASEESMEGISYDIHYTNHLSSSHALASAALPYVLPPVEMELKGDKLKFVDGGIAENIPVDAAMRFGAKRVFTVNISGDRWWCDQLNHPYDKQEEWRTGSQEGSFCYLPSQHIELVNYKSFGDMLKESCGSNTRDFIKLFGPTWPIFRILRNKLGESMALEFMSYAVINKEFIEAAIETGYQEAKEVLGHRLLAGFFD